jgi:hypothetical protein
MAGPGSKTTSGIATWARRTRRHGRTTSTVIAAFLAGILAAALFIPNHANANAGSTSDAALGVGGTSDHSGAGTRTASGQAGTGTGTGETSTTDGSGANTAGGSGAGAPSTSGGTFGGTGSATPGATTPGATTPGATTPGATTPGATTSNSGASAQGVTATSITLGVLGGSSTTIGSACSRCNNGGEATDEAVIKGLIALWNKEGYLPVDGRNLVPDFADANELDATGASVQSACEELGGDKPFVAITGFAIGGNTCLSQTYHIFNYDSTGGASLGTNKATGDYFWEVGPDLEQSLTAWADWANAEGLLKGHTLGLFAPDDEADSGFQELLNATFVPELAKLGYHLAVNYAYGESSASDDPVAAEKMKSAGVNVVFVFGSLTEPAGFQNQANQLDYHPTYPIVDAGNNAFDDSLASVSYNATAENGDLGLGSRFWDWSSRDPAVPDGNPAAAQCLDAYEQETGTTLDVYNDDSIVRYILDECSSMDVILKALELAGPDLTDQRYIAAMEQIQNLQTAEYESVSFTNGPGAGGDNDWQSEQFNSGRSQPSNDLWAPVGPWGTWAQFNDAATVAAAINAGQ